MKPKAKPRPPRKSARQKKFEALVTDLNECANFYTSLSFIVQTVANLEQLSQPKRAKR